MRLSAAIVTLILLCPAAASAEYRFAVLPLQPGGSATQAEADQLRAAIARGLPSSMPLEQVDHRLGVTDPTCSSAECLKKAAALISASLLVGGRLSKPRDKEWALSLWLFDAQTGATTATHRDQCGACSPDQATDWALKAATELINSADSAETSARLEVQTSPGGAAVTIDGSPVGISGMTFGVAPGRHTVSVALEGYEVAVREVELTAGKATVLELELVPGTGTPGPEQPRPGLFSARIFKWVTLGVAVAGLAAGITLIALDGRGTCDESFPSMECEQVYDTMTAGAVLTAVGGAAGLASGYLFYRDARDNKRSASVAPALLPGGVGLAATLRY